LLDFPNAPTNGQIFISGAQSWQWDTVKWIPITSATGFFVLKTGDTMSGPLVISQNAGALPAPTQPSQLRLAAADGVLTMMTLDAFGTAAAPYQVFRAARGTAAARTALSANDPLGGVQFYGAASAAAYGIGAMISVAAAENWTATANGAVLAFNTVAPGTTTLSTPLALGRGVICGAAYSAAIDPGLGGIYQTGPHIINQNAAALPAAAFGGLQVAGADGQPQLIYCTAFGGAGAPNAQIRTRTARGTAAARTALQTSDWFGVFSGEGSTGATTWASPAKITMIARENWTPSATGSYWVFENTPVGSTTVEAPMMLGRGVIVGGNISNDPGPGGIAMTGNLLPTVNGTQNLGSASLRWATIYTSDLSLNNGIGDWTIVEGEDDLFIYNNKSKRTFKFTLTEVDPSMVPSKRN